MLFQMLAALGGRPTLLQTLQALGLTTNLKLCLDTADPASFSSGQKWLDLSGNGHDFFRGADGNAGTDDPTFTGGVGAYDSYWALDGGDFFRYDTTNETWMENLHKNNAILTMIAFYRQDDATDDFHVFATCDADSAGDIGTVFQKTPTTIRFTAQNGAGSALNVNSDANVSATAIHMIGVSLNEATGAAGGFLYADGAYAQVSAADTFTSTYSSPSSSSANDTAEIGAEGAAADITAAGQRAICVAVWEGTALSKANMDAIWSSMRGRFGL